MSAISSLERYLERNICLLEKRRPLEHQSEGGPHLLLLPLPLPLTPELVLLKQGGQQQL